MTERVRARSETDDILRLSSTDAAFAEVLRLRAEAGRKSAHKLVLQDEFDDHAHIYLMRQAGRPVLTVRTVHAKTAMPCEMESLYPEQLLRTYRAQIMHTSRLVRHPSAPANHRLLCRLMSYVFAHEFAQGIRLTFATSPLRYLKGYRALGFAVVKNSGFSLLETGDEGRLIAQPAALHWRSPFTAALPTEAGGAKVATLVRDLGRELEPGQTCLTQVPDPVM